MSKFFTVMALQIVLLTTSAISKADELILAGLAFAGEAAGTAARYPYASKVLNPASPDFKQIALRSKGISNSALAIAEPTKTIDLKNYNGGLVSVLLLTGETVLTETYPDYNRTYINLRADALIFNYKTKSIIRSYPLSVSLFDASEGSTPPSSLQIQDFVRDMIFRPDAKGLVSQYISRMSEATLPKEGSRSIQVAKVAVDPDAYGMFPAKLQVNKNAIDDIISDGFSAALSEKTGVSVIPSKFGHALGVMTFKLANSDDLIKLKVGDGDYLVNLKLNKYKKIPKEQTAVEASNIYAVSVNVGIYEQLSNDYFLNSDFKNGEVSIAPLSRVSSSDFPGFSDSLTALFKKLATAIESKNMDWVKVSASSPDIVNQIDRTHTMLEGN